jgi:hypothetical protein
MKKLALGILFFSFIFQSCEDNNNEKIQTEVTASNGNVEDTLDEKQEIKARESVQLQSITLEEVENKYPMSTATEGLNISFSKNGFYNNDFIVLNYGGKAYLKINNQVISLKEASFKNQKVGFNEVFKNNKYKLVIDATNVNEIKNAGIEGWVSIQGNITLFDADGNTLQNISTFYAEGL